ncbi:hypothetical protein SODALDRAFT_340356 [Sodiomyces alkalinus F11]|uniref:Myb-like domain-containing protein n=1 Tax=Sodiomyces alkalinus (strain CBS 110278 / VKM F-3762 / F11) TaxID=1314773 RepID=A0A3N2PUS8_SODAK|nr:hypothetical protein SODALDRAFT_340356 [Sodiomyces alkalinus F11]ROT38096.1 hypothetical protein SODALDRAFT_340356 [Sodiomyces alkalinus F11]
MSPVNMPQAVEDTSGSHALSSDKGRFRSSVRVLMPLEGCFEIMQQWQVGPVPEYIYSNSTHQPSDIHGAQHPYQPAQQSDMQHRDQRQFQYGGPPQPSPTGQQQHQQHHSTPVQPNMNVPQQAPQQQAPPQQGSAPAATPASGRRKRPAPSNATPTGTSAPPGPPAPPAPAIAPTIASAAPATPAQAQSQAQAQAAPTEDGNSATPQPPPAKKTRTNTPWTPAEEQRLKQMRDAGNSWAEIAKTFPTRTEGSVKKHWYKDMHYAEFAEDESQALLNAIKEYENNKWKVIGQKVGKPAKACEQYAKEHFPGMFAQDAGGYSLEVSNYAGDLWQKTSGR